MIPADILYRRKNDLGINRFETCTVKMQRKQFEQNKKPTLAEIGSTNDRRRNLDYVHNALSTP